MHAFRHTNTHNTQNLKSSLESTADITALKRVNKTRLSLYQKLRNQ